MTVTNRPHTHSSPIDPDDWISATDLARKYHVSRSTAYEAMSRLHVVRIGNCVRARRSEIEERLRHYGRI